MPPEETRADIVRQGYESFNRGDLEGVVAICDPAVVCVLPEGGINTGTLEGHGGVREFLSHYLDAFESLRFDVERLVDADDRIVAYVRMSGRGRGSGLDVNASPAHVWTVEGGKVTRVEVFPGGGKGALDALGLSGA